MVASRTKYVTVLFSTDSAVVVRFFFANRLWIGTRHTLRGYWRNVACNGWARLLSRTVWTTDSEFCWSSEELLQIGRLAHFRWYNWIIRVRCHSMVTNFEIEFRHDGIIKIVCRTRPHEMTARRFVSKWLQDTPKPRIQHYYKCTGTTCLYNSRRAVQTTYVFKGGTITWLGLSAPMGVEHTMSF